MKRLWLQVFQPHLMYRERRQPQLIWQTATLNFVFLYGSLPRLPHQKGLPHPVYHWPRLFVPPGQFCRVGLVSRPCSRVHSHRLASFPKSCEANSPCLWLSHWINKMCGFGVLRIVLVFAWCPERSKDGRDPLVSQTIGWCVR